MCSRIQMLIFKRLIKDCNYITITLLSSAALITKKNLVTWHILSVHRLIIKSCLRISLELIYMRTFDITNISMVLHRGCSSGQCILFRLFLFSPACFQACLQCWLTALLKSATFSRVQVAGYKTPCVLNTDLHKFKISCEPHALPISLS